MFDDADAFVAKAAFSLIGKKVSPYVKDASTETVEKIFALLDKHGIRLDEPADRKLVAIYPTASFFKQSCLPNTALFFQKQPKVAAYAGKPFLGKVTVLAARTIKK